MASGASSLMMEKSCLIPIFTAAHGYEIYWERIVDQEVGREEYPYKDCLLACFFRDVTRVWGLKARRDPLGRATRLPAKCSGANLNPGQANEATHFPDSQRIVCCINSYQNLPKY
jgi:hypothetical protein